MNIPKPIKSLQNFFAPNKQSIGDNLGRDFLRFGNRKPLVQDWSKVIMTDKDLYTGYAFAAINNRANKFAQIATENLKTDATPKMIKDAKAKNEILVHPYLDLIDSSKTFSDYSFWYDISTFLDLEGVYYLLAVRNVQGDRVGRVQEFKLLNPYNVRRIRNKETGEIGGYAENRDGFVREIPPQMIIDIRNLNPFSSDEPYAMTDAAKEYQFTLKQAGDYTRHSLKNNMAAPGILSTDMLLEDEQFKNFVARVTNQEKGLPLFGNGAGAISWDAMQIDLDKASLDKINEINRSTLFAVSGVGKTMMSIEESGTTRETAKVQKDLFVENHIMPQLQLVIDALNQDYKKYYESEYESNGFKLYIDNPLGTDREAEMKDVEIRTKTLDLYTALLNKGYKPELAAKFTEGEITLEELGQPTEKLQTTIPPTNPNPNDEKKDNKDDDTSSDTENQNKADRVNNEFEKESTGLVAIQQSALQNQVVDIEAQLVGNVINKLSKNTNAFEDESDIITAKSKAEYERELEVSLSSFYLAIIPLYASTTLAKRAKEFNLLGSFKATPQIKREMKNLAKKVSKGHIDTILEDLRTTIKSSYDTVVQTQLSAIESTGRKVTDRDLVLARKKALEGNGQAQITASIKKEYTNISDTRAKAIARTETNRAFTQSQYQADKQFLQQNDLEGQAYKQWITRSDNPCSFCLNMSYQAPVPFEKNFADLGDVLEVVDEANGKTKVRTLKIDFEPIEAGLMHVNCGCTYQLIIK